jgi:transcriptional regulator with XRE-family HTH domain
MASTSAGTSLNPLRQFRELKHLTARRVANELGLTERTVLAYETGSFKPSNTRMGDLANLMQVDFHILEAEWSFWLSSLQNNA